MSFESKWPHGPMGAHSVSYDVDFRVDLWKSVEFYGSPYISPGNRRTLFSWGRRFLQEGGLSDAALDVSKGPKAHWSTNGKNYYPAYDGEDQKFADAHRHNTDGPDGSPAHSMAFPALGWLLWSYLAETKYKTGDWRCCQCLNHNFRPVQYDSNIGVESAMAELTLFR